MIQEGTEKRGEKEGKWYGMNKSKHDAQPCALGAVLRSDQRDVPKFSTEDDEGNKKTHGTWYCTVTVFRFFRSTGKALSALASLFYSLIEKCDGREPSRAQA